MSVFRTCLQQIFSMVKYNSDKTLLGEQKRLAAIMENHGEKEGMDVCRAIDELIEDGKKKAK